MEKIKKMKHVFLKEKDMQVAFDGAFTQWKDFIIKNNMASHLESQINEYYHQMGSLADGSFSARLFSEEKFILEGDFMVEIATLPLSMVETVTGKPGFYTVKTDPDNTFFQYINDLVKLFMNDPRTMFSFVSTFMSQAKPGFLLGMAVKSLAGAVAGLPDGKGDVSALMADACGVTPDRLECKMTTEFNGPATTQDIAIYIDNKHHITFNFDMVVCSRLNFWPPEAQEWESRADRKWPPQEVVKRIIDDQQAHLVAKPSVENMQQNSDDWRLTFLSEKRLIQEHTFDMRFTYYIFKVLFYKYMKQFEVEGKSLPSYLAKTTMHWMCEQTDPNTWSEENITENVKSLFRRLFKFIDDGHLPNYFIPAINLLNNIPKGLLDQVKSMDRSVLLSEPIKALPDNSECVEEKVDYCIKVAGYWVRYYRQRASDVLTLDQLSTPVPAPLHAALQDDDLD